MDDRTTTPAARSNTGERRRAAAERTPHTAVDEFYRTHRADAVRWATALVGSADIAEDLAHEALLAVAAKLSSITNPGGYLRRAVIHRCASWHRWHGRERRRLLRAAAGNETSFTPATNDMLSALAVLPYRQRVAVTMRYWADWTDAQIADALGCEPTSVRVMVHRALTTLKVTLADDTTPRPHTTSIRSTIEEHS